MLQRLCSFILFKMMGWKENVTVEAGDKYIIALAPHTSNFDFILGVLYSRAKGFRCDFLIKKEWFVWPFGSLMRKLGGIPVERNKKMSLTDQLAQAAKAQPTFHLCITPEGTRKPTTHWKRGFYYISLKAGIPILLYGADYATKTIHCTKKLYANGDVEKQMAEIMKYYAHFTGRHPQNFAIPPDL